MTMIRRTILLGSSLLAATQLMGMNACNPPTGKDISEYDVRGSYAIQYAQTITLRLNIGGAVRERTANGYGDIVDFGSHQGQPVVLDLSAHCGKEEVVCPEEGFWTTVGVDMKEANKDQRFHEIWVIDQREGTPDGERGLRKGLVDHEKQDSFLLGLGAASAAEEECGALAVSYAFGRFSHVGEGLETETVYRNSENKVCSPENATDDAPCIEVEIERLVFDEGAAVDGIADGKVGVSWAGACAFGPFLLGASLAIENSFIAVRTGELTITEETVDVGPDAPGDVVEPEAEESTTE